MQLLALHCFFFPPSHPQLPFFQYLGSCTHFPPLSDQRGSSHSKLWFCTKLNNRNIKAPLPFYFFSPNHRCKCLFGSSCAVLICGISANCCHVYHHSPSAFPFSPYVLCFILYLNALNVPHGTDFLAMGMLHVPFNFHVVFLLSFLLVLTFCNVAY